jgi:alkanesulfonate monooxygenase SsuD/methylene tetrahydromethanopterin reductase-like flavin-dependent oxidoreductase (luciferase family)
MAWKYEDMGAARGSLVRRLPPADDRPSPDDVRARTIAGTPEEVAAAVREYADTLGPDGSFVFRTHFPGLDPAVQREAFDVLVADVLPLLRG